MLRLLEKKDVIGRTGMVLDLGSEVPDNAQAHSTRQTIVQRHTTDQWLMETM